MNRYFLCVLNFADLISWVPASLWGEENMSEQQRGAHQLVPDVFLSLCSGNSLLVLCLPPHPFCMSSKWLTRPGCKRGPLCRTGTEARVSVSFVTHQIASFSPRPHLWNRALMDAKRFKGRVCESVYVCVCVSMFTIHTKCAVSFGSVLWLNYSCTEGCKAPGLSTVRDYSAEHTHTHTGTCIVRTLIDIMHYLAPYPNSSDSCKYQTLTLPILPLILNQVLSPEPAAKMSWLSKTSFCR